MHYSTFTKIENLLTIKNGVVSIIVSLINNITRMNIVDGYEYEYKHARQGVMFLSELCHEFLHDKEGTIKFSSLYESDSNVFERAKENN